MADNLIHPDLRLWSGAVQRFIPARRSPPGGRPDSWPPGLKDRDVAGWLERDGEVYAWVDCNGKVFPAELTKGGDDA